MKIMFNIFLWICIFVHGLSCLPLPDYNPPDSHNDHDYNHQQHSPNVDFNNLLEDQDEEDDYPQLRYNSDISTAPSPSNNNYNTAHQNNNNDGERNCDYQNYTENCDTRSPSPSQHVKVNVHDEHPSFTTGSSNQSDDDDEADVKTPDTRNENDNSTSSSIEEEEDDSPDDKDDDEEYAPDPPCDECSDVQDDDDAPCVTTHHDTETHDNSMPAHTCEEDVICTNDETPTRFHQHQHDHYHHEEPQTITCLHNHHHHHHHHHQHHHFHYQPICNCNETHSHSVDGKESICCYSPKLPPCCAGCMYKGSNNGNNNNNDNGNLVENADSDSHKRENCTCYCNANIMNNNKLLSIFDGVKSTDSDTDMKDMENERNGDNEHNSLKEPSLDHPADSIDTNNHVNLDTPNTLSNESSLADQKDSTPQKNTERVYTLHTEKIDHDTSANTSGNTSVPTNTTEAVLDKSETIEPTSNSTLMETKATIGNDQVNNTLSMSNDTASNVTAPSLASLLPKNVSSVVLKSVQRICDFLHNKTNEYKVVHDKRCCISISKSEVNKSPIKRSIKKKKTKSHRSKVKVKSHSHRRDTVNVKSKPPIIRQCCYCRRRCCRRQKKHRKRDHVKHRKKTTTSFKHTQFHSS